MTDEGLLELIAVYNRAIGYPNRDPRWDVCDKGKGILAVLEEVRLRPHLAASATGGQTGPRSTE